MKSQRYTSDISLWLHNNLMVMIQFVALRYTDYTLKEHLIYMDRYFNPSRVIIRINA